MKSQQIILVCLLAALVGGCRSQEKNAIVQLDRQTAVKRYTYTVPELQVDKTFIENMNAILFDEKRSALNIPSQRNFYISFVKKDSLNYYIQVRLGENSGGDRSVGYFEDNGYLYWFYDYNLPPNIILSKSKSKQKFLYEDRGDIICIEDPMFWFLTYNPQTGEVVDVGHPHSI